MIASISENKLPFSQRQIADATGVRELSKSLGYPSPASLIDMINQGVIVNCPFSSKNVADADTIFGPDLASIRGKTKRHPTSTPAISYLPREVSSSLVLHVDIMFVGGFGFLVSVSTPLGMTAVNELGRSKGARSSLSIYKALTSQIDLYTSRNFIITSIITDNEGGVIASTPSLNARGITVNPVALGPMSL